MRETKLIICPYPKMSKELFAILQFSLCACVCILLISVFNKKKKIQKNKILVVAIGSYALFPFYQYPAKW